MGKPPAPPQDRGRPTVVHRPSSAGLAAPPTAADRPARVAAQLWWRTCLALLADCSTVGAPPFPAGSPPATGLRAAGAEVPLGPAPGTVELSSTGLGSLTASARPRPATARPRLAGGAEGGEGHLLGAPEMYPWSSCCCFFSEQRLVCVTLPFVAAPLSTLPKTRLLSCPPRLQHRCLWSSHNRQCRCLFW